MMNRLDDLIQKYCPNGIEFKKINEVAEVGTGSSNTKEAIDNGKYPFFIRSQNIKTKNNFEFDEEAIIIPGEGGVGEIFHYINGKYSLHQRVYRIHFIDMSVNTKFIYYYMKAFFKNFILKKAVSATVISIRKPMINEFKIPIPPFPIQEEIVRILDNFTKLDEALNEELIIRKKQYEYYRDSLLNFNDDVPVIKLKNLIKSSCSGATPKKRNASYYNNGTIPWIRTQDVKFNEIYSVEGTVTEKAVQETGVKWINKNCVIIAISGATAGRCAINKIKATTNQHCLNLEIDANKAMYKYVYYCVCSKYLELLSKKQGARGDLNSKIVLDIKIPVPSIDEQKRIVSILNKFEAIYNNLIPAEIEARKKQYEYYRDKILTFKELKQ